MKKYSCLCHKCGQFNVFKNCSAIFFGNLAQVFYTMLLFAIIDYCIHGKELNCTCVCVMRC